MPHKRRRHSTKHAVRFLRVASRYHLISLSVAAAILTLCLVRVPKVGDTPLIPHIDKIVHFLMFFTFTLLFIIEQWLVSVHWWKRPIPLFLLAFVFAAFLGGAIEELQASATDYRSGDVLDWYFDLFGSGVAILMALLYRWLGRPLKSLSQASDDASGRPHSDR